MHRTRGCTTGVGCDSLNIMCVDRVNRSTIDQHQTHVQKFRPSIALSENWMLEMLSRFRRLWAMRGCIRTVRPSSDGRNKRESWVASCDRGATRRRIWSFRSSSNDSN